MRIVLILLASLVAVSPVYGSDMPDDIVTPRDDKIVTESLRNVIKKVDEGSSINLKNAAIKINYDYMNPWFSCGAFWPFR